jgi:hypothetical protein
MKGKPSRSGTRSLADELAELDTRDSIALKQRWRVLYRTEAPVHLGCFKPWPTGSRKEFSVALSPPPAACSSGPQKIASTGDHQARRLRLRSRQAAY